MPGASRGGQWRRYPTLCVEHSHALLCLHPARQVPQSRRERRQGQVHLTCRCRACVICAQSGAWATPAAAPRQNHPHAAAGHAAGQPGPPCRAILPSRKAACSTHQPCAYTAGWVGYAHDGACEWMYAQRGHAIRGGHNDENRQRCVTRCMLQPMCASSNSPRAWVPYGGGLASLVPSLLWWPRLVGPILQRTARPPPRSCRRALTAVHIPLAHIPQPPLAAALPEALCSEGCEMGAQVRQDERYAGGGRTTSMHRCTGVCDEPASLCCAAACPSSAALYKCACRARHVEGSKWCIHTAGLRRPPSSGYVSCAPLVSRHLAPCATLLASTEGPVLTEQPVAFCVWQGGGLRGRVQCGQGAVWAGC